MLDRPPSCRCVWELDRCSAAHRPATQFTVLYRLLLALYGAAAALSRSGNVLRSEPGHKAIVTQWRYKFCKVQPQLVQSHHCSAPPRATHSCVQASTIMPEAAQLDPRDHAYAKLMQSILGGLSQQAPVARRTRSHLATSSSSSLSDESGSSDDEQAEQHASPDAALRAQRAAARAANSTAAARCADDGADSMSDASADRSRRVEALARNSEVQSDEDAAGPSASPAQRKRAAPGELPDAGELELAGGEDEDPWPVVAWAPELATLPPATASGAGSTRAGQRNAAGLAATAQPGASKLVRALTHLRENSTAESRVL